MNLLFFFRNKWDRQLPSTVEARRMIPQFKEDLFHVKSSRESFNENCPANRVVGHANVGLRKYEYVIPETSFEIVLHFWKVKVWTKTALDKLMSVMVKVQSKVKERSRYGRVVNGDARFVEMPSSGAVIQVNEHGAGAGYYSSNIPNNEHSWIFAQFILFSTYFKVDLASDSIAEIDLSINHIGKRGCT